MNRDIGWRHRVAARSFLEPPVAVPTLEQIAAVIERHGLDASLGDVAPLPRIGTVNSAFVLGPRYVLRVPKALGALETRIESIAAPVAKAAGVKTPALLVYDDTRTIFEVPFTVFERVDGENFGTRNLDRSASSGVYREIGRQLAQLHLGVDSCNDPDLVLREPRHSDPDDLLEHLGTKAYLGSYTISWLARVFERLRPAVLEAQGLRRFLHNDILPTNVLVRGGELAAVIDWNDAGWGDPALEFVSLPARALPDAIAGYSELATIDDFATFEHRTLWAHLCLALEFLLTPTDEQNISWARPPFARLVEITAMAARHPPWQALLD